MSDVIIIGGGWSGLTCAYQLAKHNLKVTVLEAASMLGGRAREAKFNTYTVDNGQHLCIGAYYELRQLLQELGCCERELFHVIPLSMLMLNSRKIYTVLARNLPAPWNLLTAILLARGLKLQDKIAIVRFCYSWRRKNFKLITDCTVNDLLTKERQTPNSIKVFWEPLTLAALTTPIAEASAQVLLNILQQVLQKQDASNWLLPTQDLTTLLPKKIATALTKMHSKIITGESAKSLILSDKQCEVFSKDKRYLGSNIVLATPAWRTLMLLQDQQLPELQSQLKQFVYHPIVTIYFEFADVVGLEHPIYGLLDSTTHWIFDRRFCQQPQIISAVISGPHPDLSLNNQELADKVFAEIYRLFPHLPELITYKVIREKLAAFACTPQVNALRPQPATNCKNLWLTGDYINSINPATLETAIANGKKTAEEIIASLTEF